MSSVKDYPYCAKGDSVSDDTESILQAQNAGCKYYPDGKYVVTNPACIRNMLDSYGNGILIYNGKEYPASSNIRSRVLDLPVPDVFPDIQFACDWAMQKTISSDAMIRVIVADGEYRVKNITPRVKHWDRFQILGNVENNSLCRVIVDATDNGSGFVFNMGNGCNLIDGFTITGENGWISSGQWNAQSYGSGIFCEGSGTSVIIGTSVSIDKLYYGVRSKFGSHVAANRVKVTNAGDCGFHAYAGTILAYGAYAGFCRHTNGENLGFGFCAEAGGHMECEMSNSEGCQVAGFYSLGNASMWAHGCESYRNIGHGFYALNGGYLEANGHAALRHSNAFDNGGRGYYALNGGIMQTSMSWADRNGGGNYIASNQGLLIS